MVSIPKIHYSFFFFFMQVILLMKWFGFQDSFLIVKRS